MNNDNVVKIGKALKWRNTFDLTQRYYQENIVTACGCVFRCKVLQAQGKSPIKMTDDQGHIVYTNTDVWDVLVDMAYYYNYAVDTRKLTQEMLAYAKKLDEAFKKQQKEIEAIQKDNLDQWSHINAIETHNTEQQREIDSILDTISCFSEGIWIDTLLWSNETIWDNNKYAITDDLQNQINELTATHCQDIKDLTDKHDSEISSLAAHIIQQEKIQDGINTYLQNQVSDLNNALSCFGSGIWENDLHWSQEALWDNNKYAITDALTEELKELTGTHKRDVEAINKHLIASDKTFSDAMTQNAKEHRLVNEHLGKHDTDIKNLQTLINEHDRQIIDLLDRLTCYSEGQWDNNLKWSNQALWKNSNQMCDTFDDLYQKIADHQKALNDLARQIIEIELESPTAQIEALEQMMIAENRKIAYKIRAIGREQTIQNTDIARLGEHFCCYADGIWGDLFVWDNELFWANQTGVINVALEDIRRDIRDTRYKLNEANEDIMTNLSLIRANHQLIKNNAEDISQNRKAIDETQQTIDENVGILRSEALTEHRQVAYQLRAIDRDQAVQNENIAKLGEHFNCFVDGVWCNLFLWENDDLWANTSGVVKQAIDDIHVELDSHQKTLDAIIEENNEHFTCFSDDVWCNSSGWDNGRLWPSDFVNFAQAVQNNQTAIKILNQSVEDFKNTTEKNLNTVSQNLDQTSEKTDNALAVIAEHQEAIEQSSERIDDNASDIKDLSAYVDAAVNDIQNQAIAEHRQVTYQLRAIEREQIAQDENIAKLGEHFGCFVDGQWGDIFLWNNNHLWHNQTGVVEEAISDIHQEIDEVKENLTEVTEEIFDTFDNHQTQINELWEQNSCMDEGKWNNTFFWNNVVLWLNTPESLVEVEAEINKHDTRLSALENQFKLFMEQFSAQQTIIRQQQEQLDTLMDCFTVLNVGKWQNLLLWDNSSKWSNELITEASASNEGAGTATVTVKSYDPATATVSF